MLTRVLAAGLIVLTVGCGSSALDVVDTECVPVFDNLFKVRKLIYSDGSVEITMKAC